MKRAELTIIKLENEEDCRSFQQSHKGGFLLKPGDVTVEACIIADDGEEQKCGQKPFQGVDIKDPSDGRKTLHSVSGLELASQYIDSEILDILD